MFADVAGSGITVFSYLQWQQLAWLPDGLHGVIGL